MRAFFVHQNLLTWAPRNIREHKKIYFSFGFSDKEQGLEKMRDSLLIKISLNFVHYIAISWANNNKKWIIFDIKSQGYRKYLFNLSINRFLSYENSTDTQHICYEKEWYRRPWIHKSFVYRDVRICILSSFHVRDMSKRRQTCLA